MFFIKGFGLFEVFSLEQFPFEVEYPHPNFRTNEIVGVIAQKGSHNEQGDEDKNIERVSVHRGNGASGEKQGISGEQGHDNQSGFNKNDGKKDQVGEVFVFAY